MTRYLALRSDVELLEMGDEAVAWAHDGHSPCYLDPASRLLLSVMDGNVDEPSLTEDVVEIFGVDHERAMSVVTRVVRHLDDHRILEGAEDLEVPSSIELLTDRFLQQSGNG